MLHAGIIGCGNIAKAHAQACRQAGLPIVLDAYCDQQEVQASKFLAEFGGRYATTSPDRLADDPALDAIYICSPNHCHLDNLAAVAPSGKAVFMEKPLVTRREDFTAMAALIDRYRLRFFPGLKIRFNPMMRRLRELAPQAHCVLGQVIDGPWGANHWQSDPARGGGHCLSQGIYAAEGMRYLSGGEPIWVTARGYKKHGGSDLCMDTLAAVFEFDNGCAGALTLADTAPAPDNGKFLFELFGPGISAALSQRFTRLAYRRAGDKQEEILGGEESGMVEENRHFVECLLQRRPFELSFRDGWVCSEMIFAALESIKTQQPVRIDPWRLNPGRAP